MKKLLLSSILFFFAMVYFSCNDAGTTGGMSDRAKKNLDLSHSVTKMFESGDFSKIGDYIAADAVDHAAPGGEVKGLDSIKAMFTQWSTMMKDTKIEVVKELADDDYVIMWIKQSWTATMDDPMMNMKAGDKGTMESVEVTKHNADSKVTDHWGFISMNDMMKMMPQQGNMNPPAAKDTTGAK
jgi:predicted SnoaL-like aldol condensation-catalyzing enzyme